MIQQRDWHLPNDFTGDGIFTISDLIEFFVWFFTYPGDHIVRFLIDTDFGIFLEFSALDYGGLFSWVWSFLAFALPISIIKEENYRECKTERACFLIKAFHILIFGAFTGLWLPFLILFGANV